MITELQAKFPNLTHEEIGVNLHVISAGAFKFVNILELDEVFYLITRLENGYSNFIPFKTIDALVESLDEYFKA